MNGRQISVDPDNWEDALFVAERKAADLGLLKPRPEALMLPFVGAQFAPLGYYWSAPVNDHGKYFTDVIITGCRTLRQAEAVAEAFETDNGLELATPLIATKTSEWGYWLSDDVKLYAATDAGDWNDTYAILLNSSETPKPGYGDAAAYKPLKAMAGQQFGLMDPGDQIKWSNYCDARPAGGGHLMLNSV